MPGTTTSPATPEAGGSQVMIPIAFVTVVILMVLPIPTVLLDLFLTLNIALSLVVLLPEGTLLLDRLRPVLERFPDHFEQQTLLRVHLGSFTG